MMVDIVHQDYIAIRLKEVFVYEKNNKIIMYWDIIWTNQLCIYIGLFPNEVKKHNSAIQELRY